MSLLDHLLRRKKSASMAKDRLKIIIAQERFASNMPDYLPMLRKDIMEIIAKYTKIDPADIVIDLQSRQNQTLLELNVTLPEYIGNDEAVTGKA